jgi:outer membrane protein assembly factor BamB
MAAMIKRLVLVPLLLLLGLQGCSWFAKDTRPKPAPVPELKSFVPVRTLWSVNVGDGGDSVLAPALVGNAVYAASRNGLVSRLDAGCKRRCRALASEGVERGARRAGGCRRRGGGALFG